MDMTLPEVTEWIAALGDILQDENGSMDPATDHRARVEADMKRLFG